MHLQLSPWIAISAILCCSAAWAEPVGTATRLNGTAWADATPLAVGAAVPAGAELRTGASSRLTLGEQARMAMDKFVYAPEAQSGDALLSLKAGVFLMVTGAIGKLPERPLKVATPVATIGIRGTTFWGGHLDNPLDVMVLDGAVTVVNGAGSVELGVGQGTGVPSATDAPTPALTWGQAKVQRALDSVAWR